MEENPFEPPSHRTHQASVRDKSTGPYFLWACVVVFAAIAAVSSLKVNFYKGSPSGLIAEAALYAFWLCPPLAILIVIAYREKTLWKLHGGQALYNAVKFCLTCICFLIVGYVVFVPSCVGATLGVVSFTGVLSIRFSEDLLISIVTFVVTILSCIVMHKVHKFFRKQ